jgi:hypothetical protein
LTVEICVFVFQGATPATALLNGLPLAVKKTEKPPHGGGAWEMPPMEPRESDDATSPLVVAAESYSFVALPTAVAPACSSSA